MRIRSNKNIFISHAWELRISYDSFTNHAPTHENVIFSI